MKAKKLSPNDVQTIPSPSKIEEAKKIIEEARNEELQEVSIKIDEILKQYNCQLIPVGRFEGNTIETQILIKPM